jgi:CubicO group peptidase (beta-lactamase class C family)
MPVNLFFAYCFVASLFLHPGEPSSPTALTATLIEERKQELIADRFGALFSSLAANQGFNGNVLLSTNGKVVYKHAFGYSNLKQKTPLHLESVFQLASVTKQFTSSAIMILHDRGLIDFNDPIQKYFPELPYKDVTIRLLLGHRSGIPDYMCFAGTYWRKKKEFLTNADVLEMLIDHHPRSEFTPNARYKYSNTGYALLALVVEKVSGLTYRDFMEQHIFAPLGMKHTFVWDPTRLRPSAYFTQGYNKNLAPAHEDFLSGVVGDKGVYTTVDDMYTWDEALSSGSLIRQETLAEAFTPLSQEFKYDSNYGYGWRITGDNSGRKVMFHAGWWRGYTSLFVRRPEDRTCIIVLSNKVNWCFRNIDTMLDIVDLKAADIMALRGE